ncbi:PREDICTED: uncharacterized protein LOC105124941 [Populus euphratica]|uniref:Uncharacterized protein LOC105124941 n=1 Tax=Populus euphratica TaxID=75702 RepID=A0AAJ6XLL8_POPEU|nr:PREDICTED: uncharacterized protein LOC105124941 [Populus euphratica]
MVTWKIAGKKIGAVKHQVRRMMINLFLGVKIRNLLPESQNCFAVERTLITVEMLMKSSLQVHCWPRRLIIRSMQDRHANRFCEFLWNPSSFHLLLQGILTPGPGSLGAGVRLVYLKFGEGGGSELRLDCGFDEDMGLWSERVANEGFKGKKRWRLGLVYRGTRWVKEDDYVFFN